MSFSHPPVVIAMTCLAKNAMNFLVLSLAPEGVKVIEELFHSNPPRIAKDLAKMGMLALGRSCWDPSEQWLLPLLVDDYRGLYILVGGFNHLEKY